MATLKSMLAKFVDTLPKTGDLRQYIWTYLPRVTMAYNSSIHPALGDIMNGYDPRTLADLFLLHQEEKAFPPQMETIRQHWRDGVTLAR
jgi:hypothetical protein